MTDAADVHEEPGLSLPADQVRLLTKVARLYHERGVRQPQIAAQLHLSQPRVSRLLKQAVEVGIVRTTVVEPRGVHASVEDELEARYGLAEVVVADTEGLTEEHDVLPRIAAVAAGYLESTLSREDRIGISSWSSTLLATVDAMHPRPTLAASQVVQILGGYGSLAAQSLATRLTGRLAQTTRAEAVYLLAPGLLAQPAMRTALLDEPAVARVLAAWEHLTVALVGIGSLEPSDLLRESGNAVEEAEQRRLRRLGAIGDVCLRFFDADGRPLSSDLDDRVLGIPADRLRAVPRRIAVAGGQRKWSAVRAAVAGGWVDTLVTDLATARSLLDAG